MDGKDSDDGSKYGVTGINNTGIDRKYFLPDLCLPIIFGILKYPSS
jgi:hypothetical protein